MTIHVVELICTQLNVKRFIFKSILLPLVIFWKKKLS